MLDIEEYSKKMKGAELFQGMGFNRILEFKEDAVRFEFLVESRHCHSGNIAQGGYCLLYTSPSPRDMRRSRMPSSA